MTTTKQLAVQLSSSPVMLHCAAALLWGDTLSPQTALSGTQLLALHLFKLLEPRLEGLIAIRLIKACMGLLNETAMVGAWREQTLAIADNRYATWTDWQGWLDLQTGENVEVLPATPLETVAYNVGVLLATLRRNYPDATIDPPTPPDAP